MARLNRNITLQLRFDNVQHKVEGIMEDDRYARLPKRIFEQLSSVRDELKDGAKLNNVWGIITTESGKLLEVGDELYAKIRFVRDGVHDIVETAVLLGVVIAIEIA